MNKNENESVLTTSDKKKLSLIASRFELAEQIIGPDPLIYFEFNLMPPADQDHDTDLISNRYDLYSKLSKVKSER